MIVLIGDNFYDNGIVLVDDFYWQIVFENVYYGFYLFSNWYVVLGNYDYWGNWQV